MAQPVTIERGYGDYRVKIRFAPHDVPGAEERILGLITQAYLQRVMSNAQRQSPA